VLNNWCKKQKIGVKKAKNLCKKIGVKKEKISVLKN